MKLNLVVIPTMTLLALGGCTVAVDPTSEPSQAATSPAAAAAETAATSTQGTPEAPEPEPVWTYHLVRSATRPAEATSATLLGDDTEYPNSTSLWVGCDGAVDEVTVATSREYSKLVGRLGLRAGVPTGLVVHVLVLTDGQPVQNVQLDSADPNPVDISVVVTDVEEVTFRTQAVEGTCGASDESYAVLAGGYVT